MFLIIPKVFSCRRNAQTTVRKKPHLKIISFKIINTIYIRSDKALYCTVVSRTQHLIKTVKCDIEYASGHVLRRIADPIIFFTFFICHNYLENACCATNCLASC